MGKTEPKNETSTVANRIQALLEKRAQEDKEIAGELEAEIDRLKNELKTAAKNYKTLTGKEVRFSIGPVAGPAGSVDSDGGAKLPPVKNLILTELAGGDVLAQSVVADRICAKHPGANKGTITQTISKLAKDGEVIEKSGDGVKITKAGENIIMPIS